MDLVCCRRVAGVAGEWWVLHLLTMQRGTAFSFLVVPDCFIFVLLLSHTWLQVLLLLLCLKSFLAGLWDPMGSWGLSPGCCMQGKYLCYHSTPSPACCGSPVEAGGLCSFVVGQWGAVPVWAGAGGLQVRSWRCRQGLRPSL